MLKERLEKIYYSMEELKEKKYRQEYEELLKLNKDIDSFENYIKKEEDKYNNIKVSQGKIDDAILERNTITKENIVISIYLINYSHILPAQLDKNYKPLPLKEMKVFEYGSVISFNIKDKKYDISGLFNGIEESEINAFIKYNDLKEKAYMLSEDELLDKIEKEIKEQKNRLK